MQHVFLIGLSGSGKSTVGRLLAKRLNRRLLDVDALIEEEYGERIPAIFARHGEDYFRELECRVFAQAVESVEEAVVVTGGGIVVRPESRVLMAQCGVRVFLQVDPATAIERLQQQFAAEQEQDRTPEIRPLLAGSDPLGTLQRLLAARLGWYQEADFACSTTDKSVEQVAEEIVYMLMNSGHEETIAPIVRHVHVGAGYDAVVDWGGLGRLGEYLQRLNLPPRIFVVTDSHLRDIYGAQVMQDLARAGFEPFVYAVPAGEASKSHEQVLAIYDWLVEHHAERREALVALGGGVVGDLVGYVAATYLRGIPLVQVPTSLLAQVDAAIGGKTGINHPRGKNLIGAFYHPRLVLADPELLFTLPERSRTEGWAEVVKYGMILDAELFVLLESHADELRIFERSLGALLCQIIARCIDLKVMVVEEDEREQGRRAILNYGHTVGHALENASGYGELLHGEAVAIGMMVAAGMAQEACLSSADVVARQSALLVALGLPIEYHGTVKVQTILSNMQLDKKVVGKRVRWIMPLHIGEVMITPMPDELVAGIITAFFREV